VTQKKAKSFAISPKIPLGQFSLLVIIVGLLFCPPYVHVKAQNTCNFSGQWETQNFLWNVITCSQTGSTVHCDYQYGSLKTPSTIDGSVSADGKTVTGKFYTDEVHNGHVIMVLTSDYSLSGTWYYTDPNNDGVFWGERIGSCESVEEDLNPDFSDPNDNTTPPSIDPNDNTTPPSIDPLLLETRCMDRSCEETGCEDGVFYTLQTGILDLESSTCIINSPEMTTFSCGYQGGDTEYYDCDYVTNTCAYGFMVPCDYGCDETTGRCLQYIEDDPDDIILPPEPLDDCDGGCPYAICQGETSYYGDPECRDGICYYEISEYCPLGCNTSTGYCLKGSIERGSDIDQLVLLLGVAGGGSALIGGGLLGGGLLGLRALRGGRILLRNPNPAPPIEMDPITKGLNQTRQRVDELLEQLKASERQHLQDNLDHSVKMMDSYHRTAERTETIELLPNAIGWAAGKAADYVGMLPAGKPFKYGYKFVTKAIEEGIDKGVGTGFYEGLKEVGSDAIGDKIGDLVKVKDVKDIADFSIKTSVKAALKETGVKTIGKNILKDKAVGSGIEDAKGIFDSLFGEI
jgi:hypothetical protein